MSVTAEEIVMRIRASSDAQETAHLMLCLLKSLEGLSVTLSRPFQRSGVLEGTELLSVSFLAASAALRTWDQERGGSFVGTYRYCLLSELVNATAESAPVHISSGVRDRIRKYKRFRASFTKANGREPSDTEICNGLKISQTDLDSIKAACAAQMADSLDRPIMDGDDEIGTLGDTIPCGRNEAEEVETALFRRQLNQAVSETLRDLPSEEVKVIRLRYAKALTVNDTASQMGITPSDVRRISGRALRHLRDKQTGLMGFLAEQSTTRHTGLQSWKNSGSSQPEFLLIEHERDSRPWRGK